MTQSEKMVGLMGWATADQAGWRKGPWNPEEDKLLTEYVTLHGEGRWSSVARSAGLNRTGKSCRLRWVNYLRPGLKRGQMTLQEEGIIIELHALWGNKWSTIARYLPGRTDNEIKNYWRTHFKKKERPSQKMSERRNAKISKIKPLATLPQALQPPSGSTESCELQTMETNMLQMEQLCVSSTKESTLAQSQGNNNKQEFIPMCPNNTTVEEQTSWMIDAICHDQDGLWWGNLWNFGDQIQQEHQYCGKMALQNQSNATSNINIAYTDIGISWGDGPRG